MRNRDRGELRDDIMSSQQNLSAAAAASAAQERQTQDMDISPGDSTPTSESVLMHDNLAQGPVLLAAGCYFY